MTQAELAAALRVSQNIVGRLESGGRSDPRLSTVIRLTQILGISIDSLTETAGLTARARTRASLQSELIAVNQQVRTAKRALMQLQTVLNKIEQLTSFERVPSRRPLSRKQPR